LVSDRGRKVKVADDVIEFAASYRGKRLTGAVRELLKREKAFPARSRKAVDHRLSFEIRRPDVVPSHARQSEPPTPVARRCRSRSYGGGAYIARFFSTMRIAIIGTGFIGGILGRALARSGHEVTFGSRHPDDREVIGDTNAVVASVDDALAGAEVIVLALPGAAVPDLVAQHGTVLERRLVIDATNQMGAPVANCRTALPASVRYVRAFNTLGGENMENPMFEDGPADLFFSAPETDRALTEAVIEGVGLRPIYVGENQERLIDALFELWIALAIRQGRGRRLALRLIDH